MTGNLQNIYDLHDEFVAKHVREKTVSAIYFFPPNTFFFLKRASYRIMLIEQADCCSEDTQRNVSME